MKKLISAILPVAFILFSGKVLAAESLPAPAPGLARIAWSIKLCGDMPKGMTIALILTAAMIIITVCYSKMRGGNNTK